MSSFRSIVVVLLLGPCSAMAEESLPRILILGDQVYAQPARDASKELSGRAVVVFVALQPGEVRNSTTVLKNLDTLLGEGDWDLIHFNVGLGDLVHRAPGMKSFRVMSKLAGGVRTTSAEQYRKNLHALVEKLAKTKAKLVWASTTPIRHSASHVFVKGTEIEYNAIAAKVMASHGVPINDMYESVKQLIDMKRPAGHGVDPFFFDRKPLHPPIVRSLCHQLSLDNAHKTP